MHGTKSTGGELKNQKARTFEMPAKPGASGSNPGGKHRQAKGDETCGTCGKGGYDSKMPKGSY